MHFWEQYSELRPIALPFLSSEVKEEKQVESAEETVQDRLEALSHYDLFATSLEQSYRDSLKVIEQIIEIRRLTCSLEQKSQFEYIEKLVQEYQYLSKLNGKISENLNPYDYLGMIEEEVNALIHDNVAIYKKFTILFKDISHKLSFFERNPHFKDASKYIAAYKDLQEKWVQSFLDSTLKKLMLFYTDPHNHYKKHPLSADIKSILNVLCEHSYEHISREMHKQLNKLRSNRIKLNFKQKYENVCEVQPLNSRIRQLCEVVQYIWNKELAINSALFPSFHTFSLKSFIDNQLEEQFDIGHFDIDEQCNLNTLCEITSIIINEFADLDLSILNVIYTKTQRSLISSVKNQIKNVSLANDTIHPIIAMSSMIIDKIHNNLRTKDLDDILPEIIDTTIHTLETATESKQFLQKFEFLAQNILALRNQTKGKLGVLRGKIDFKLSIVCGELISKVYHDICNPVLVFLMKVRFSDLCSYQDSQEVLYECSNRIMNSFSEFKSIIHRLFQGQNKIDLMNACALRVLKTFEMLLSHMKDSYPGKPLPSLHHIQGLLYT